VDFVGEVFMWRKVKVMRFMLVLIFLLAVRSSSHAIEGKIEEASIVGDTMYLCVSREGRSYGRSFVGEQPLFELKAWSLESHEISLSTGRSVGRWKVDVKRELRLDNSVQKTIRGMAGQNVYFEYSSALYLGPTRGRTNQHGSVVLFNRNGLRSLGAFPTNLNVYHESVSIPGLDGSLKQVFKAGAVLYTTNGVQTVPSPLSESPALAADWNAQRTAGFWWLTMGTFGPEAKWLWHLRYPPGPRRTNRLWDESLEMVQQIGPEITVLPIRHADAVLLWDGAVGTTILSKAKSAGASFRVDGPDGEGPNLGISSGAWISDPTARTLVLIQDTSSNGYLQKGVSLKVSKHLKMTVFRIEDGKLVSREVKMVLE
jgi:hypothetical protein